MLVQAGHGQLPESQPERFSGPETGKRNRVTRKADGQLTLLVTFGGPGTKS